VICRANVCARPTEPPIQKLNKTTNGERKHKSLLNFSLRLLQTNAALEHLVFRTFAD